MNSASMGLGIANIGTAILIVAVSIPLVMRKIKMNRFYGVRIPKSFSSEKNWFEINAYAGKQFMLWSLLPLLAGIACFFVNIEDMDKGLAHLLLGILPIMLAVSITFVQTMKFAGKL